MIDTDLNATELSKALDGYDDLLIVVLAERDELRIAFQHLRTHIRQQDDKIGRLESVLSGVTELEQKVNRRRPWGRSP